eukprot:TCONS_00070365-protein
MMNPEVESHIKNNFLWTNLPANVKQTLGNNKANWDKSVSDYCIKNQFRYKQSLVKQVRKDEKKYYQELVQYSRQNLMLYPYHLSDIVVKGLRLTPFGYYIHMMNDIMTSEKSYDSLPNFTAADCLRLLGIGRNQYIDMMNQCKSSKRFFRAKRPPKELLPVKPIPQTVIKPWWIINSGYITDDDIKTCTAQEVKIVDTLIDDGAKTVHEINTDITQSLYNKGFVYFDVPIKDTDYLVVPPLENFVMNRVLGDYMETMLYKVFVSIDEETTVAELAQVLEIDLRLVKTAVSLFCRLGITQKKNDEQDGGGGGRQASNLTLDVSSTTRNFGSAPNLLDLDDFGSDKENGSISPKSNSNNDFLIEPAESTDMTAKKRIAFLFDSTLTAFLMMGNLSQGLKRHAVTMFEVGKLSDETMENFVSELEKIEEVANEGEAQRYFDHAVVLKKTIQFIRNNTDLTIDSENQSPGLDLVRCESMNSLDPGVCARILTKKYSLLISMAPLSNEIRPISSCWPPHIGPAIPEVNSVWFKLFLYSKVKKGPPSLLLVKGTRLSRLPKIFKKYDRLLITTWGHDPAVVATSNVLFSLNDALTHSPVLVQAHGYFCEGETQTISFPFDDKYLTKDSDLEYTETIQNINQQFDLSCSCGYVTLINTASSKHSKSRGSIDRLNSDPDIIDLSPNDSFDNIQRLNSNSSSIDNLLVESVAVNGLNNADWIPLELCYGIPLFDDELNIEVTRKMVKSGICQQKSLDKMTNSNRMLSMELLNFITEWQEKVSIPDSSSGEKEQPVTYPTKCIVFQNGTLAAWS